MMAQQSLCSQMPLATAVAEMINLQILISRYLIYPVLTTEDLSQKQRFGYRFHSFKRTHAENRRRLELSTDEPIYCSYFQYAYTCMLIA